MVAIDLIIEIICFVVMASFCSVFGCSTQKFLAPLRKDSNYVFSFPKESSDKARYHQWHVFCGRDFTPGPKAGICHRHFTEEDLSNPTFYDFKRASGTR